MQTGSLPSKVTNDMSWIDFPLSSFSFTITYKTTIISINLTIVAVTYCTGLLLARRVLKMLEMDEEYQGNVEVTERF